MFQDSEQEKEGLSLRTIHIWLIIGALVIAGLLFYSTYQLSSSFKHLTETSEKQLELRDAAHELMDASDYLTEKAQRFTIDGDKQFMEEYFNEAFNVNRREEAIETMSGDGGDAEALEKLQAAMEASLELMNREYYSMKLVIEAKGYKEYPDVLKEVELSDQDKALSSEEKMRLATEMVLDEEYYEQKEEIRANMKASLEELQQMAKDTDDAAMEDLRNEVLFLRIVILLQILVVSFMVWLTAKLGIHPVLNAVERIKDDSPIPETGANEFRYLACTYNKMYEIYKKNLENLNFKASHDELTGAYNRSGYELILTNIDIDNTYMMLFDIDNFKDINDTYGHETGDKVLIKIVQVLKNNFRSEDYVCRVGGDEFVVFMVNVMQKQQDLIASKIRQINANLCDTSDGLPATSVSVGIVHGHHVEDVHDLFEETDKAMYESKSRGKNTYTFYSETQSLQN